MSTELTNGGFETGDLTGWEIVVEDSNPTVVTATTKEPHSGNYCLQVIYVGVGEEGKSRPGVRCDPFYFTSPDTYLSVGCWHAAGTLNDPPVSGADDGAPVRGITVEFYNLDGTPVDDPWFPDEPYVWLYWIYGAIDTDWHYVSQSGTIDYGPGYFYVELPGAEGSSERLCILEK